MGVSVISVCVPTYENPISFSRTFATVLQQRDCDFEVIITDDSRSDGVFDVVKHHLTDRRVRYFRNAERLGAVRNWNYALSLAKGHARKLLHHDDWLDNEYALGKMVAPILEDEADVVFSACKAFGVFGQRFVHEISSSTESMLRQEPQRLVFGNLVGAPSVSAVSSNISLRFDPQYLWMSDVDYYIRLMKVPGLRLAVLKEPLVCISTEGETQISRTFEQNQRLAVKELYALVKREYPNWMALPVEDRQYLLTALAGFHMKEAIRWLIGSIFGREWLESYFLLKYVVGDWK